MKNESVIYCIAHSPSGRCYVGSALIWSRRRQQHLWDLKNNRHGNKHLQRAWNKYGESAFKIIVIESNVAPEKLLEREQFYMDSLPLLYNTTLIAKSRIGCVCSKETRKRMSNAQQNAKWKKTEHMLAHLKRISRKAARLAKGKPRSAEIRAKISKSHMGIKSPHKGVPRPLYVRLAIGKAHKGMLKPITRKRWESKRRNDLFRAMLRIQLLELARGALTRLAPH